MSLWVDKYRPTSLSKLDYHKDLAEQLKNLITNCHKHALELIQSGDFPHLLFYGPSGAGKKTRIMAMLRELYGAGVEKLRVEHQTFETPSKKKIEITTVASNYHIEINPSDAKNNDRVVIQGMIKSVAQTQQLDAISQKNFKVIVVMELDRLTKDAQHALRRTMEKYISTCRLILCCNSTSRVIPAVRSRCLGIRVAAPTADEARLGSYITQVLHGVCKKEGLTLNQELAVRIAEQSKRNLRRALLMCEACKVQQYPFTPDQPVSEAEWEIYLRETAAAIVEQQNPKRLLEVRARLYELLCHCIPPDVIIKGLLSELIVNSDGQLKTEITALAAFYEHRIQMGRKAIFHLEAFVAKFMSIYKRFLDEGMAAMDFM
ncbi:Replication factor C subunit 3 [Trichoplax sp. H2]|nr:Replication factor C subunit 3 [Trichoplax sp. H2]|eukprot:RDD39266.1 Replication factor C subunit 3 [Trichoplax sp. H2]